MMSFRTVSEALEIVGKRHADLRHEVEGLKADQLNFRPHQDSWTIAEIVEHVSIVQEGMSKVTSKLVKDAQAAGAMAAGDGVIADVKTDFITDRKVRPLMAPELVRPSGGVAVGDSLTKLENDFVRLQDMRPRIEAVDLSNVTFPHPAFGPLSGYQWLALLSAHEARHLEQIREIKANTNYPA